MDDLHNKVDTLHAKLNRMCGKFNEALVLFKSLQKELNTITTCRGEKMLSNEFLIEEEQKGTYSGMKFSDESVQKLLDFAEQKDIPNTLDKNEFHTTLLYSRKYLKDYKAIGEFESPIIAYPMGFEVWVSPANAFKDEDTRCLVLKYKCQEQEDRFNELMDEHDATYDFDEYKTHVTISYDVGPDFDEANLDASLIGELELVSEYKEDLNLDKTYK